MRPLAIVGNLSRDLVGGGPPRAGGAPYYAAHAFRLLGRPARVVTKCAPEDRRELLPELVALGIPVTWHPGGSTATFSFRYEDDVRVMEIEALGDSWTAAEARGWVAEALAGTRWVHVAPLARSDFPPATLAELARGGRRISLDGQGLVRRPRTGPLALDADFEPELLRHVSILKLAEEEASVVLGDVDERSVRELGVPEVIVTLGARGSIVFADGRERVPARAILDVDPTGAGDAFAVAYLAARSAGFVPAAAARRATALVAALLDARRRAKPARA